MHIILSNSSKLPIYGQIKEQIIIQILSGELQENEMLPSLRQLAKDLKISVLTTTRAYNELEEAGYITCNANEIKGKDIHLDFPSVGATENIMLVTNPLFHPINTCSNFFMGLQ